jgi:hypothetical protein
VFEKTVNAFFRNQRICESVNLFVAESVQTFCGSDPDILIIVFKNRRDPVVDQTIARAVICKPYSVETADTTTVCSEPHTTEMILLNVHDLRLWKTIFQ